MPGGVDFRVWAPDHERLSVVVDGRGEHALQREPDGHFRGSVDGVGAGARYRFRPGGGDRLYPDPWSRAQPEGPHGPSVVVDPDRYAWTDAGWTGARLAGAVIYELHVGTFTREGTWAAAERELPALADLGVTAIELMPVAEFPGRFGWGYDGVDLFAPHHRYGAPDDMRRFVDRAHAHGVAVLLDVVYNHLGPDGNYLRAFAQSYFSTKYRGEWGDPFDFEGDGRAGARALVVENAAYWIREFHIDGLRLDATQGMFDASEVHVIAEISRRVRSEAGARSVLLIGENEPQQATALLPLKRSGWDLDAVWNDDLHHAAKVALTGRHEAYCSEYRGAPQELVSAAKHGWLYQGQRSHWQKKPRGTSTKGVHPRRFVAYLQNHDQVANSASGARLHETTSAARARAATAMLLLGPWTPMLFMGQERRVDVPFLYFADHEAPLAHAVRQGRGAFLAQFPTIATREMDERLADPAAASTYAACVLDGARDEGWVALHRDLLEVRRTHAAIAAQGDGGFDGAVLGDAAFCWRWRHADDMEERLLLVNLGRTVDLAPAPEPLLAPPGGAAWRVAWSSEDPRYGGCGTPPLRPDEDGFHLHGESAVLLRPERT